MVVLSEKLKGKSEFRCRSCGYYKPIGALGNIITTSKKEEYCCSICLLKYEKHLRRPSIRKHARIKTTNDLKTNVDKYIKRLNLNTTE